MSGGWERIARHDGGSVFALATATTAAGTAALFAATAAGIFSSDDAGKRWHAAAETPLPLLGAITPSPQFAANRVLYAGAATGFFRSTDAGQSWRQTLTACRVFAIACVSGSHAEDSLFIGTDRDGVLRSDDGGRTWGGANPGLLDRTVLALSFSADAVRDQIGFAATASGLYRTRNGGKSWREVAMPCDEAAVQCLAISPAFATDGLVLAGTERDGLWRSDDCGVTWEVVPNLAEGGVTAVTLSPRFGANGLVAAATADGVRISRDRGTTWQRTASVPSPVISLAYVTDDGGDVLAAGLSRGGIARLRLDSHGAAWVLANDGLGATLLTSLCLSPRFAADRTLAVAGPEAGIRLSRDGGETWIATRGPDAVVFGLALISGPDGDPSLLAATETGIHRSHDGGATWDTPTGVPCAEIAATISASGSPLICAATFAEDVLASEDGGNTWRVLGIPVHNARVRAIECAPDVATGPALYATTAGNHHTTLWRSADGGATWARWFEEQSDDDTLAITIPRDRDAAPSAVSPLVGYAGRVWQPRARAWQTRGDARFPLWSSAPLAAPGGEPVTVNALAASENYASDGMVFAATSAGVFRSRDHGRTFDWWSRNLVPRPVLAIAVPYGHAPARPFVFALGADSTIWRRAVDD